MSSTKKRKISSIHKTLIHKYKVCKDFIGTSKYDLTNHLLENMSCVMEYFICYKCKKYHGDNEHGLEVHFSTQISRYMGCKEFYKQRKIL